MLWDSQMMDCAKADDPIVPIPHVIDAVHIADEKAELSEISTEPRNNARCDLTKQNFAEIHTIDRDNIQ